MQDDLYWIGYGSSQWLLLSSLPLGWRDRVMERSIELIGAMVYDLSSWKRKGGVRMGVACYFFFFPFPLDWIRGVGIGLCVSILTWMMWYQGRIGWRFAPTSAYSTCKLMDQGLMREHVKAWLPLKQIVDDMQTSL